PESAKCTPSNHSNPEKEEKLCRKWKRGHLTARERCRINECARRAEPRRLTLNRKHRVLTLFALLAVSAGLWAAQQQTAIAPERIKAHVDYLASPEMKGRGTGTPELNKASKYIAAEFKRNGLEPLAGKSYFQKFRVTVG